MTEKPFNEMNNFEKKKYKAIRKWIRYYVKHENKIVTKIKITL